MTDIPFSDPSRLIAAANAARGWSDRGARASDAADAERRLEDRYGVGRTLAVYGTLAPGRPNHDVVAPLGGEWTEGVVEGDLSPDGWGATQGYPALRPRAGGPAVQVWVLRSDALAEAWLELDEFEGPGYRRILVPVFHPGPADARRLLGVANLYAAAPGRGRGARPEQDRKRTLEREARARERAAAEAALPLPKAELAALLDHLDERLGDEECDDTLRLTSAFLEARVLDVGAISDWLRASGAYCDCEVLANVGDEWDERP